MDGSYLVSTASLLGIVILICLAVGGYVWSLAWLYHDVKERGKSVWFMVFLTFLLPGPLVVVGWLIFRPAKREDLMVRHHWDGSLSCARCGFVLLEEGERCRNCRVKVRPEKRGVLGLNL